MEKTRGEIRLGNEPLVEELGCEERVKRPGIERVKQVRIGRYPPHTQAQY